MSVHYTLTKHINLTVFLGGRHTYQLVSISHLHCGQGRSSFTTVALKQQVATVATVVAVSFKIIILLYWLDVMMSCEDIYICRLCPRIGCEVHCIKSKISRGLKIHF